MSAAPDAASIGRRGRGRPTPYSDELGELICARIAAGESLRSVCSGEGMPSEATVRGWVVDDAHARFSAQYARAVVVRAYRWSEEIVEKADEARGGDMAHVQACRLEVDARKWLLSKLLPREFGDRLHLEDDRDLSVGVQVVLPANGRDGTTIDHTPAPMLPDRRED